MNYIETLDRKYRNTGAYEMPQIMAGWRWVDWLIDGDQVGSDMTPRETFDLWIREGKLEHVTT